MSQIVRWDFQKASTPLVDEIASATLAVADGASTNTTDGLVITTACDSRAASTSLPAALSPARPISVVLPMRFTTTNAPQSVTSIMGWQSGAVFTRLYAQTDVDSSPTSAVRVIVTNGETTFSDSWTPGAAPDTDVVLIAIFEAGRKRVIANGTTVVDVSGSFSGGIGTTDFRIGKDSCVGLTWRNPFAAIYDHALSAGEIAAIGSSFSSARTALFAPVGPSPAEVEYYRRFLSDL